MIGCGVQSSQRRTNINTSCTFVRGYANFPNPRKEATVELSFATSILEIVPLVWAVIGSPKHCKHVSSVPGDDADVNMEPSQLSTATVCAHLSEGSFIFICVQQLRWFQVKKSHLRLMASVYKYWTTAQLWVRTDSRDAEFSVTHRVSA